MKRRYRNLAFYVVSLLLFGLGVTAIVRLGSSWYGTAGTTPRGEIPPPTPLGTLAENLNHPLGILLLQLIVIILAARGMGRLFGKIGQPRVIGEVVAGILLGPSLLGSLAPEPQAFIFPPASLGALGLLSQLGVILFMFTVGVDLDFGYLRKQADTALLVSHASMVFPFLLGTALALAIFPLVAPAGVPFGPFALFLGVAMSITAFPVLARIVAERRLTNTPIGNTAIACAAVGDATAWCLLAVVIALVKATGLGSALTTVALAVLFTVVMLFLVRPQTARLFAGPGEPQRVGRVSGILAFVFAAALISEAIGIHPLFGAFLAGVAMPPLESVKQFVRSRLETLVSIMLLPLFFAFTGLRTQIGLLGDWQSLLLLAGIVGVAILGKFGGSTAAARWTGMSWADSLTLGTLMNTRGLVELIALNIGYDLRILSPRIFTMLVLMAVITTFMAGPMLALITRLAGRSEAAGGFGLTPSEADPRGG